jgi:hypothetical protein
VAVEDIVMHFVARQQFGQYMPELLTHAQQAYRAAFGACVVMFGHI